MELINILKLAGLILNTTQQLGTLGEILQKAASENRDISDEEFSSIKQGAVDELQKLKDMVEGMD